jgi:sterol 14-demethylase
MGNAFALLQVKTILAHMLRNFTFDLTVDKVESDFQGLVIGPKMPIRLRYRKLDRSRVEAEARAEEAKRKATTTALRPFRVIIDRDLCQGHGVCEGEAPEIFQLVDERVTLLQETPDPSLRAKAEAACRYCPQHVISIEDLPLQ